MLSKHTHRLLEAKLPTTKQELGAFLGIASYYRQFLPNYAQEAALLQRHTNRSKAERRHPVPWTDELTQSFHRIKSIVEQDRKLFLFDNCRPTRIRTDASSGLGGSGVLE